MAARYDLADRPAKGTAMSRGKPVQEGVRVKLSEGTTWEKLAALSLEDTLEFFNLVLELKLNAQEKKDLLASLRVL